MNSKPTIALSHFLRGRMSPEQPFSHFAGTEMELLARAQDGLPEAKQGYREGILEVPVDPAGFYSPVCDLTEGDRLVGEYKARREGEEPRIALGVEGGEKTPAKGCSLILYSKGVLEEDGEELAGTDYEIVMIQARTHEGEEPMHPDVMLHNYFGSDGGTDMKQSPEEFLAGLGESVLYWKSRAMLAV